VRVRLAQIQEGALFFELPFIVSQGLLPQNVPPIRRSPIASMGKKPKNSGNITLPPGSVLPRDENVIVPSQAKHAAAVADALARGQPVPPRPQPKARPGFPRSAAEIDQALQLLRNDTLQTSDPEFKVIRDLAEEGARQIEARRRGAGKPREKSDSVKRRIEAVLQAYRELSPNRQAYPTGKMTLQALRQSVIKQLGLDDDDDAISEDTIKHDLQELGHYPRLVREGIIPPLGPRPIKHKPGR
jgi:hypothetical protein